MLGSIARRIAWQEAVWIAGGQVLAALGTLVGVRLLTSVLDPAAFGQFALGLTCTAIVHQVLLGPLANTFERFFSIAHETAAWRAYFAAVRATTLQVSLLATGVGVVVALGLLASGYTQVLLLVCASLAFALLSGWEVILDGIQNGARRRGTVALHQALRAWLRPAMAVLLLTTVSSTSGMTMTGYLLASVAALTSQTFFYKRTVQRLTSGSSEVVRDPQLEARMLSFARPFRTWGIFTWVQASSDRWALQALGMPTDVGLYSIVFQMGSYPLNLLGAMVAQLAGPIVYAHIGSGAGCSRSASAIRICMLSVVAMLAMTLTVSLVAACIHHQIFTLLTGEQFWSASPLLPWALLSAGLFNAGQVLSLLPLGLGNSRALLAPKLACSVLAVILNIAGAAVFGISGVVAASVLFAVCYLAWIAIVTARVVRASSVPQCAGQAS